MAKDCASLSLIQPRKRQCREGISRVIRLTIFFPPSSLFTNVLQKSRLPSFGLHLKSNSQPRGFSFGENYATKDLSVEEVQGGEGVSACPCVLGMQERSASCLKKVLADSRKYKSHQWRNALGGEWFRGPPPVISWPCLRFRRNLCSLSLT